MIKQKYLALFLLLILLIPIPNSYAQITFNHAKLNCPTDSESNFSAILGFLRICPIVQGNLSEEAPTFTQITSKSVIVNWIAVDQSENLYGYEIRISTNDVTFINVNENTADTVNLSIEIEGLDFNTQYYVIWRNVFFDGSPADFSPSGTFTTLQQQGGGGPEAIIEPPVEDIEEQIIEDLEKEEIILVGLSAIELFMDNTESIRPGQTKNVMLVLIWEGDSLLTINNIVANEDTGLVFAFTKPIQFSPSTSGVTTSKIPYTIEAPLTICQESQTTTCVFLDATYQIPIRIFATSNNEDIIYSPQLKVFVDDPFEIGFEEIGLGVFGLFIFAVIAGKKKRKDTRSRIMNSRTRPNLR